MTTRTHHRRSKIAAPPRGPAPCTGQVDDRHLASVAKPQVDTTGADVEDRPVVVVPPTHVTGPLVHAREALRNARDCLGDLVPDGPRVVLERQPVYVPRHESTNLGPVTVVPVGIELQCLIQGGHVC